MKVEETYKSYEICLNPYANKRFEHTKYIAINTEDCDAYVLIGKNIEDLKTQIDDKPRNS